MSTEFIQGIDQLIRAGYSVLYIVTWEEERVHRFLAQIAEKREKTLYEWRMTDGLRRVYGPGGEPPKGKRTREPLAVLNEILQADAAAIYILKDFHHYLEAPEIARQLRDLGSALRHTRKSIVIVAPVLKLPPELEKTMTIIDLPLPKYDELKELLETKILGRSGSRKFKVSLSPQERTRLVKAAQGLTLTEAENAFAMAIVRDSTLDGSDIQALIAEKRQIIRKSGILEYYDVSESLASVGGMDTLKDWLKKRLKAFSDEARQYGLPQPRGILLMGVQGCGKSLVAKTIASSWRLPLLRMDMSRIFQGFIGSSEQNMRKAVKIAESLAPVVLWIDEIEKAFSGVEGSSSSDAGTTARVVGTFLTWIQEKTAPVFVVATANEVKGLPPELLRKGRLDEIFFVDLPRRQERAEIFKIHLAKVRRDPAKFDIDKLAAAASGFSGAEIEQAIISALHDSFFQGREVETSDIITSITETVPLSKTMHEKIGRLREWAHDRARPVSSLQRVEPAPKQLLA
ncbi:MAG TPA: AAA family ATPase [Candidatus Hydrogenedentes bacterium]|nr:AAA family ATPase [Candidatus Hydrogenedentota bacterium]